MNKKRQILLSAVLASALASNAQVTINVDASNPGIKVSPNLYGIFFEDINHAADGGLYAELISNRSFEDDDKNIPTWKTAAQEGAKINAQLINKGLLNNAQGKALQLTIAAKPAATASLINEGFWGINAVQGRTYKLSFWAKGSYKGGLKARLTNAKGDKVYAETTLNAKVGKKWTKYTAELTANGNDAKAQFELVADGKGTIVLDVVSLFPPTFKNRENGLRPDLAQLLYNIHPKFVRFPGGCYVEGQESPENAFHWEKTIGPIEERPGHKNVNWRYRTSDGMGFDEYLQLAEDLNAKPLYVVNVGLWHGGMTPVDSIQPWIDECMNALEYANGPVTSKYGALRAKNGHPEPYNIEYLLMSRAFFDGTDGLLPMESVLRRLLSFHVATAGEAHELGTDVIEKLCKVGTQTVLAIHECRREEADDVQCNGALAVEDQLELSFRVVGVGCKRGSELAPLLSHLSVHGCLGIHALAVGADEASLNAALVASFSPKRQLVSSALHGIDAPETLVDERCSGVLTRSDVYLKSLSLSVVEQSLADELRRDGCSVCSLCAPCGSGVVAVLERAVADKLSVETAVRSMIDVLEEDAVEIRRHLNAGIGYVDVYLHLCVCCQSGGKQCREENVIWFHFFSFIFCCLWNG